MRLPTNIKRGEEGTEHKKNCILRRLRTRMKLRNRSHSTYEVKKTWKNNKIKDMIY